MSWIFLGDLDHKNRNLLRICRSFEVYSCISGDGGREVGVGGMDGCK